MAPRRVFEKELEKLSQDIIQMGELAEQLIDQTIIAVIHNDKQLAEEIIKQDDTIDEWQLRIEKECALLIARQQPVAKDLRFIMSIVKIVTDLERIGDHCSDICQYSIKLNDGTWNTEVDYKRHIEKMAHDVKEMLNRAINSFFSKDIEAMKQICKDDDKIDSIFVQIWKEIIIQMSKDKEFIPNGAHYLMIIKYLERIADHTTNIAEWILYSSTGKYIIHQPVL